MIRTRTLATVTVVALATGHLAARETSNVPTIDQALELKRVGSPVISPDGRLVAYTVRETNWDENAFETEIWMVERPGADRLMTRNRASSRARRSPAARRRGHRTAGAWRSSPTAPTSARFI